MGLMGLQGVPGKWGGWNANGTRIDEPEASAAAFYWRWKVSAADACGS